MAPPNKPVIGNLYSPQDQSDMHRGTPFQCAPMKDGRVLLLRLKTDHNPDTLHIVDRKQPNDERVQLIEEQTQRLLLPVYVRRRANEWEYMGRFRVARVAKDDATLAEREAKADHIVNYAIYLERS